MVYRVCETHYRPIVMWQSNTHMAFNSYLPYSPAWESQGVVYLKNWLHFLQLKYLFVATLLIPWSKRNRYISSISRVTQLIHVHMHTHTPTIIHTTRFEVTAQVCWSSDCDFHALVSGMDSILYTALLQSWQLPSSYMQWCDSPSWVAHRRLNTVMWHASLISHIVILHSEN